MAFKLITGLPGSGKSYYAVWYVASTYFDRTTKGKFKLKDKFKDIKIISNIENLKLPHLSLEDILKNYPSPANFFSYSSQEKISSKYPQIIYLIDEAQFYFPVRFRDDQVFNWFQLHRHFGQDIYLITQVAKLLPDQINALCEMQIDAVPRSNTLFFGWDLHYNFLSKGQIVDKTFKFKRKWVFDLYKSQSSEEIEKPKNPFIKYMALLLIAVLFGLWNAKKLFQKDTPPSVPAVVSSASSAPSSPAAKLPPAVPEPETLIPVPLSYLVQDGAVYVVFQGVFYQYKKFPYKIENGPFKTIIAHIPERLLESEKSEKNPTYPKKDGPLSGNS